MKIHLKKVTKTPLEFELKNNKITFKGFLEYHSAKLILLKAKLFGLIHTECSSCGDDIELNTDEEINFFISDGLYEGNNDIELDVVETFDSIIDMDELLHSEVELIKSDYHCCEKCK